MTGYPYAFLVRGYGNEVFQVQLPSQQHDAAMNGQPVSIRPFPTPESPDPARFGSPRRTLLDLTGRGVVKGEVATLIVGYEEAIPKTPRLGLLKKYLQRVIRWVKII